MNLKSSMTKVHSYYIALFIIGLATILTYCINTIYIYIMKYGSTDLTKAVGSGAAGNTMALPLFHQECNQICKKGSYTCTTSIHSTR